MDHDSELCISILKTFQKLGLPLTKGEQGFLRFNKNRDLAIKLAWEEVALQKKDKEEWLRRYHPQYYKWSKDPESAFRLLETWPQDNAQNPLDFIKFNYPQRIGELRARMLDKMPSKFWGNSTHQMILYALYKQKEYISEKEKQLLIDNNYIPDPNDPREAIKADKTGNLALLEIAKFSKYSDECISYFTGSSYLLWRIGDLRQIADHIPPKHYGSKIHLEILYRLLSYGEPISEKERELLKKKYRRPLPKEDWIKYLTEVKLKAIRERQGK